jgi:hypothetical protein
MSAMNLVTSDFDSLTERNPSEKRCSQRQNIVALTAHAFQPAVEDDVLSHGHAWE